MTMAASIKWHERLYSRSRGVDVSTHFAPVSFSFLSWSILHGLPSGARYRGEVILGKKRKTVVVYVVAGNIESPAGVEIYSTLHISLI